MLTSPRLGGPEHVPHSSGATGIGVPLGWHERANKKSECLSIGDDLGWNRRRAAGIGLANGGTKERAEVSRERLDGEDGNRSWIEKPPPGTS